MTYIYILEQNNIPFYVGKSVNPLKRKHKHFKTYGNDIIMTVVDECDSNKNIWKPLEGFWINYITFLGFNLVNKNIDGGGGPTFYTQQQKNKMKGPRPHVGNKISKTLLKNNHSKYYTKEIRKKMSDNLKGSHGGPFTENHIQEIKNSKRKISKRVLQYDLNGKFIKEWKSKGEAADWINIIHSRSINQNIISQIKDCCYGRMISCWDYIWRYKDEFIPLFPKYYPIEQYKDGILINTFYNELEAEKYVLEHYGNNNKNTKVRDLIKKSIKNNKKYKNYEWKYKK